MRSIIHYLLLSFLLLLITACVKDIDLITTNVLHPDSTAKLVRVLHTERQGSQFYVEYELVLRSLNTQQRETIKTVHIRKDGLPRYVLSLDRTSFTDNNPSAGECYQFHFAGAGNSSNVSKVVGEVCNE
ncbi:MAG: hypothetical protein AAF798_03750 [Bacteroidota bacterium]